jgi:hypothetical protein
MLQLNRQWRLVGKIGHFEEVRQMKLLARQGDSEVKKRWRQRESR